MGVLGRVNLVHPNSKRMVYVVDFPTSIILPLSKSFVNTTYRNFYTRYCGHSNMEFIAFPCSILCHLVCVLQNHYQVHHQLLL